MLAGNVDLKTWYKPEVNKKILKELSKRSDSKGIIDVSLFIIAILASGYLCVITWGTLWSIPALLLYGNIFLLTSGLYQVLRSRLPASINLIFFSEF